MEGNIETGSRPTATPDASEEFIKLLKALLEATKQPEGSSGGIRADSLRPSSTRCKSAN